MILLDSSSPHRFYTPVVDEKDRASANDQRALIFSLMDTQHVSEFGFRPFLALKASSQTISLLLDYLHDTNHLNRHKVSR